MSGKGENNEKKNENSWLDRFIKIAGCTAFLAFLASGFKIVYKNAMEKPSISCYVNEGESIISFESENDFRNITLFLYPELEIRYEKDVLLYVHLIERCDPEYIQFDSTGHGEAKRINQEYYDQLVNYFQHRVKNMLAEQGAKELAELIDEELIFEEGILGGIMYMSKADGQNIKRFCIIEKDGMIREASLTDREVEERLYNWEIRLNEHEEVDYAELNRVAQSLAEELIQIYKE